MVATERSVVHEAGIDWHRFARPIRDGLSVVGVIVLAFVVAGGSGIDAHAYWAFDPAHPYREAVASLSSADGFRYAPPIALLLTPLHALPWLWFRLLWIALEVACLWLLLGRWALAAIAFYPVALEIWGGNVNIALGLAVAVGFRWPAAWSFVVLTKLTPGVGLLWFAVRREWRSLTVALGATLLISLPTVLVAPDLWRQWISSLAAEAGLPALGHPMLDLPLWLRLIAATALVAWGARTNRQWTVVVGACLALPTIWWSGPSVLSAIPLVSAKRVGASAPRAHRASP